MAVRRRSLPQLVVSVPCRADWASMTRIDRAGRTRFCDSCERPVYDSASMTRDELADLIALHEGKRLPCVRLHRRPDGTVVTRDCFAPLFRVGRFFWLKVGLAAAAFWAAVLALPPLMRLSRRDGAKSISSEEIKPRRSSFRTMQGMLSVLSPTSPAEHASLLAKASRSTGWPSLPAADRAPPLRTLESEDEIWNPGGRP